ncbi:hypothetical protein EV182_001677 [Spiromyces aspiralis]|uniref:Uncharacterized protein n=1 Tax=Spiromyces aspiralis TaxID=68401 RepID=A0ACC1HFW1_9FUNG|nr:hypothetical protein EV182_001677 [Spiromyces aspiralis]
MFEFFESRTKPKQRGPLGVAAGSTFSSVSNSPRSASTYASPQASVDLSQLFGHLTVGNSALCHLDDGELLDQPEVDLGIAILLRSKQESRLGNPDMAAQLYLDALKRIACAIKDTQQIADAQQRDRLESVRDALASTSVDDFFSKATTATAAARRGHPLQHGLTHRKYDIEDIVNALFTLTACLFATLGRLVVWVAVTFQKSQLPELILVGCQWLFRMLFSVAQSLDLPRKLFVAGQYVLARIVVLDEQTQLSQKLTFALITIAQSLLRHIEVRPHSHRRHQDHHSAMGAAACGYVGEDAQSPPDYNERFKEL